MPQSITRLPALAAPIVPLVNERPSYTATSQAQNQVHVIVGREDPEATLRPATMRVGTISLLLASRAAAFTAFAAHRGVGIFTLTDTDVPDAGMAYIVTGAITIGPAEDLVRWRITFGFQEVKP